MAGKRTEVREGRVVVGLSGGVDSAVAAALLLDQGYDVHAVAIRTWHPSGAQLVEPTLVDEVAASLRVPLAHRDLRDAFYKRIVTPFLDAYARGQTPNPCVFCNPTLKLSALSAEADRLEASWIATGHYARVVRAQDGVRRLFRAKASGKDQSYALYRLTQAHLSRLLLPLGDVTSKDAVRETARRHGLPNAKARDSQDLCFAAGSSYRNLLLELRPDALRPGPIYDQEGNHLGEHKGLPLYTIGQRSGLGIAASERRYVLELNPADNAVVVGPRSCLSRDTCALESVTYTTGHPPAPAFPAMARIRYRAPLTPAHVVMTSGTTARITFHHPQEGVAPGQSLVLYHEDETLGGGVITG